MSTSHGELGSHCCNLNDVGIDIRVYNEHIIHRAYNQTDTMFKKLLRFARKLERLHQATIDYQVYKEKPGHISKGQWRLYQTCKEMFSGCLVVMEHSPIWLKPLRLDVAVLDKDKRIVIAGEYHGKQHHIWTPHFHDSRQDFVDGQARDDEKRRLCEARGIVLIEIDCAEFNDETDDPICPRYIQSKIMEGIEEAMSR